MSALADALNTTDALLMAIAELPAGAAPPAVRHIIGRRSGCLCVTTAGALATDPGEVAAVRWDGSATGPVAELARLDVEEMRPGFTLSAKRCAGALSSAAPVEPQVGG